MTNQIVRYGLQMRKFFDVKHQNVTQWFPGHMAKGLNQMQKRLRNVDCIIEVHDARIPLSGRNPVFHNTLSAIKPHILVLNKMDLADLEYQSEIIKYYERQGIKELIFTNCKEPDSAGVRQVIPTVTKLVKQSDRYNRAEELSYQLLIIGVPNVGKSSLINALRARHMRKKKATKVGGVPGITQSVLEKIKVCDNPPVYLFDTPGVLAPKIGDVETGLKLALAATIKDHLVGEDKIADYLLYKLNLEGNHTYVEYLGLDEPTDDINQLLGVTAVRNNWIKKIRSHSGIAHVPDFKKSAATFIKGFRLGKFGPMTLDDVRQYFQ